MEKLKNVINSYTGPDLATTGSQIGLRTTSHTQHSTGFNLARFRDKLPSIYNPEASHNFSLQESSNIFETKEFDSVQDFNTNTDGHVNTSFFEPAFQSRKVKMSTAEERHAPILNMSQSRRFYTSLLQQPKIKKEAHYSDVRTAFRRYNDLLKLEGIYIHNPTLRKKTAEGASKKKITRDNSMIEPKKSHTRSQNLSMDDIRPQETSRIHQKGSSNFEVCFVFPEFFKSYQDIGKNSIKVNILKYWLKYNKIFKDEENVLYFQNVIKKLKDQGHITSFYDCIESSESARGPYVEDDKKLPSQEFIRKRIENLQKEGFYSELIKYLVAIYSQSLELDERSLDAMQGDIARQLRIKFDLHCKIDTFMFLNGEHIRTILDIPTNPSIIFAGQSEKLSFDLQFMHDTYAEHKREEFNAQGISWIKTAWFKNHISENIPKNYDLIHSNSILKTEGNNTSFNGGITSAAEIRFATAYSPTRSKSQKVGSERALLTREPWSSHKIDSTAKNPVYKNNGIKRLGGGLLVPRQKTYKPKPSNPSHRSSTQKESQPQQTYQPTPSLRGRKMSGTSTINDDLQTLGSSKRDFSHQKSLSAVSFENDEILSSKVKKTIFREVTEKEEENMDSIEPLSSPLRTTVAYEKRSRSTLRPEKESFEPVITPIKGMPPKRSLSNNMHHDSSVFTGGLATSTRYRLKKKAIEESGFKMSLEERQRILDEYPTMTKAEIHEIYSQFLILCEVSARKEICAKAQVLDKIHNKEKSIAAKNARKTEPKWALARIAVKRQEQEFESSKLNVHSDISREVLVAYNDFLKNKPEQLRERLITAAFVKPDTWGMLRWENFLNFYVTILKGKGTLEHQVNFMEKFFYEGDQESVARDEVERILYYVLSSNRIIAHKILSYSESIEQVWEEEFVKWGCVEENRLIREKFLQALRSKKINSESFLKLMNDKIGIVGEHLEGDEAIY